MCSKAFTKKTILKSFSSWFLFRFAEAEIDFSKETAAFHQYGNEFFCAIKSTNEDYSLAVRINGEKSY